jgi:hypothetical protein
MDLFMVSLEVLMGFPVVQEELIIQQLAPLLQALLCVWERQVRWVVADGVETVLVAAVEVAAAQVPSQEQVETSEDGVEQVVPEEMEAA